MNMLPNQTMSVNYTIDLIQPSTRIESHITELQRVADILSYPLLIRPSSNTAGLTIINNPDELKNYLAI